MDQLVHCLWFLRGRAGDDQAQPVVPDGRLELVVHRGDPFGRLGAGGLLQRQAAVLVAGQLTGPIHLKPGRVIDTVGVRLTPLGAHALLGLPLCELTNLVEPLSTIRAALATCLEGVAGQFPDDRTCATAILGRLGASLRTDVEPAMAGLERAMAAGAKPGDLGRISGWSLRTVQRRFESAVGLSPRLYHRVVRFRRAFRALQEGAGRGAAVAAGVGYYDQAHLIREFRHFTGASPRRFFTGRAALAKAFSTS
jgi:AraC-like DNA-binding protein